MPLQVSMESFTSSNELTIFGLCFLYGACSTLMIWILSHFEFNTHFFDGNPFRSEKKLLSFECNNNNDASNNFSKEQSTKTDGKHDGENGGNKEVMNETVANTPTTPNQTFTPGDNRIVKSSEKQVWSASIH